MKQRSYRGREDAEEEEEEEEVTKTQGTHTASPSQAPEATKRSDAP